MKYTSIILAAGTSKRMKTPKVFLRWGNSTVIETIIAAIQQAGVEEVLIVAGGNYKKICNLVYGNIHVKVVFNPHSKNDSMMTSLQTGVTNLSFGIEGCLVFLGDQPMIQPATIQAIIQTAIHEDCDLIIPSFQFRRGHPLLIKNSLFPDLLKQSEETTLRDFIEAHNETIHYVDVPTNEVLLDIDTPEDYKKYKPLNSGTSHD